MPCLSYWTGLESAQSVGFWGSTSRWEKKWPWLSLCSFIFHELLLSHSFSLKAVTSLCQMRQQNQPLPDSFYSLKKAEKQNEAILESKELKPKFCMSLDLDPHLPHTPEVAFELRITELKWNLGCHPRRGVHTLSLVKLPVQ